MKLLSILFSALLVSETVAEPTTPGEVKGNYEPIAVLELFTSQGCSSCPPADALLNKIINEEHRAKIFGLSFHVSYWNHLGWTDPHSSENYSKRQYGYSSKFTTGVYTPQVVVNGTDEYVGGNRSTSEAKIKQALSKPATVAIDLSLKGDKLTYKLRGDYVNSELNVAVVQNETTDLVKRGENGGRKLVHRNVVLSFQTQRISAENGEMQMHLPENSSKIIAYLQNPKDRHISGASQMDL